MFLKRHRDFGLAIAGEGFNWYETNLRSMAAQLGVGDDVVFLGPIDNAELPFLYSGASAVVLPSRYETFGRSVGEAMACGVPTASAATSSLPEVVGEAGLLFDPDDARGLVDVLERLSQDALLCEDLRHRGLERAKEFTWERTVLQTHKVLAAAALAGKAES
jgi:glycosyltransferase involved in cell wall biosynthesis